MEGAENRPDGEQFAESSASDQVFAIGNPIDLVGNIRALIEEARLNRVRQGYTEFYPHWWLYNKILETEVEQGIGENKPELGNFLSDIRTAYGIAAYPQFTPRQQDQLRQNLRLDIRDLNIGSVTLNEQQRQVLSLIAAATDTPIDPDQEEYQYATVLTQPDITEAEKEQDPRYNT